MVATVLVPLSRLESSRKEEIEGWPWLDQGVLRTSHIRQVLHFRPTLWDRWSQRLELSQEEALILWIWAEKHWRAGSRLRLNGNRLRHQRSSQSRTAPSQGTEMAPEAKNQQVAPARSSWLHRLKQPARP